VYNGCEAKPAEAVVK